MKNKIGKNTALLLLASLLTMLVGCGSVHTRTDIAGESLDQYKIAYIVEPKVYSMEEAAETNKALQDKLWSWKSFAQKDLESYFHGNGYKVVFDLPNVYTQEIMMVDLDVNVKYGNRALRYWVGFGAGAGSVDSVLKIMDLESGEELFKAVAESDLSVGRYGGDVGAVVKKNIQALVNQVPIR
ncbi:hypothetical protein NBRC116493_34730 [Aurantivibrio infirmus]